MKMLQRQNDTKKAPGKRLRQAIMIALCACFAAAPLSSAVALEKKQLVDMSKLGLDDAAIKGAIDSAGDELMFTEDELKDLKAAGVSQGVIDYLRQTGHVKTKAGADTTSPPDTPPDTPPDVTGPDLGGPDIGKEDDGRVDAEKLKPLLAEVDKIKEEKGAVEQQLKTQSTRVTRAIGELKKGGDNMAAARPCLGYLVAYRDYLAKVEVSAARIDELVGGNAEKYGIQINMAPSPEASAGTYQANYCLARALFNEEIYSGASRPLVQVLQAGAGPDRPYFKDSFYMLEKVTAKIGYKPPILVEITATNLDAFNKEFRNDFNYYFGKFFFDYNEMEKARGMLAKVEKGAEDYPEAKYLEGVAFLGSIQTEEDLARSAPQAINAFQGAILAAEQERGGNEEILQLGYMALARTFYEVGNFNPDFYNVALFYYQKLPTESSRDAEAKLELAWTYFLKNDHKKALGLFQTLNSPYYSKWFFPDIDLLEATIYLNLCKFEKSKLALAELDAKYLSKQQSLKDYIAKMQQGEPSAAWKELINYYEQPDGAKKTGLPRMFADAVLNDLSFFNTYKQVRALQSERDALKANIGSLGEFGQEVLAQVEERLKLKTDEGGLLVLQKLSEINQELDTLSLQATQISFDIDKEEKDTLAAKLQNPDYVKPTADSGTTLLVVADDWHPWPFEGEYWIDEVSNYRSNLRSECVVEE